MKVFLVDDHPLFLDGLRNLLASRGIDVVGTARGGLEALGKIRACRPDVVLLDIQMPELGGLATLRMLKAEFPEVKVVMLTMSARDDELFEAIKGGACGYLLKSQDTDEVFRLLEDAARGEVALSPGLANRILLEFSRQGSGRKATGDGPPSASLSPRETQVLTLVASGLTYKEVGAKLFVSARTIKYHMGEIIARLHVENRAGAIDYAKRSGILG